ncbi:magnesium transporter [bacterium]|nr:magnesium transporter [bacterium]
MTERLAIALDELVSLAESGERQRLRILINDINPYDLAEYFQEMEPQHRLSCFRLLDLDNASAVLTELEPQNQRNLLKDLGNLGVVPLISNMSPDDAADILSELSEEKAAEIIEQIPDIETKADIKQLLSFDDDTAGGIMSTDYLSLYSRMTVGEALDYLREQYEDLEEDIYDVYVVDEANFLVGVVKVRELITTQASTTIEVVMDKDLVKVTTSDDQEEAAKKVERYDLHSLPVVDTEGKLCGVITSDDIMDVLREEATEDIYQSSGINATEDGEELGSNVRKAFAARLPWLLITLGIETGSCTVITHFDAIIQQTVAAASFMPLLSGVTGSVATQSTCIVIRSSGARDTLTAKMVARYIWHEVRVGLLLAICCGVFTFIVSLLISNSHHELGLVVACSLVITMTFGVTVGTAMPMVFKKIGIDPAHASGPFITSLLDVSTMTIYLTIVHHFLSHIV